MVKMNSYQITAVIGSSLLMGSGMMRFSQSGSPKELFISILYFMANILIFCF